MDDTEFKALCEALRKNILENWKLQEKYRAETGRYYVIGGRKRVEDDYRVIDAQGD